MSHVIMRLESTVATLYAELVRQCEIAEASRNVGDLDGTFVEKSLSGKCYVYLQYSEAGKQKQKFVGEAGSALSAFIENFHRKRRQTKNERENREKICSMLRHGGAHLPDMTSSKILELLADSGVFALGAVLVGSHAFGVLSNVLGVRWPEATRTQDIDLAQDTSVSLTLSREIGQIDLPGTLERANMGFHPVPGFNPRHPSTSFKIRGRETLVDLLVPSKPRGDDTPVELPSLKAAAQPLKNLDYLLIDAIRAVIPAYAGILLCVPDPARFAIHKLAVAGQRPVSQRVKSAKDLRQAELLLGVLEEDRSGDIALAARAARPFGSATLTKMRAVVQRLSLRERTKRDLVAAWKKK